MMLPSGLLGDVRNTSLGLCSLTAASMPAGAKAGDAVALSRRWQQFNLSIWVGAGAVMQPQTSTPCPSTLSWWMPPLSQQTIHHPFVDVCSPAARVCVPASVRACGRQQYVGIGVTYFHIEMMASSGRQVVIAHQARCCVVDRASFAMMESLL